MVRRYTCTDLGLFLKKATFPGPRDQIKAVKVTQPSWHYCLFRTSISGLTSSACIVALELAFLSNILAVPCTSPFLSTWILAGSKLTNQKLTQETYDRDGTLLARRDRSERFFEEVFWHYNFSRLAASHYDSGNAPYSKYLTPGVKKRGA